MTHSIDTHTMTPAQARARTAELVAECPIWCTEVHEADQHPVDVQHSRVAAHSPLGDIEVIVYPIQHEGRPPAIIYVPEDEAHGNFDRDRAVALADSLTAAAGVYDEVMA